MENIDVTFFSKSAVVLTIYLSMPSLLVATAVGLTVALFQATVQLQEQVLGFVSKLVSMAATFALIKAWMSSQMTIFFDMIFMEIIKL